MVCRKTTGNIAAMIMFTSFNMSGCGTLLTKSFFNHMDKNSDGFASFEEFRNTTTDTPIKEDRKLFNEADINKDGRLTLREFRSRFLKAEH